MIANIAPTSSSSEHSLNSLRYAGQPAALTCFVWVKGSCPLADRVKQLRKGGAAAGKAAVAACVESVENSDPNEERRVSKELCLQEVVFPIDDNMSSGGDDFLPEVESSLPRCPSFRPRMSYPLQLEDDGVSDTDSLDAAMCDGRGDMSMSSFKVTPTSCRHCFGALNSALTLLQGAHCAREAAKQREEADEEGIISS
jgi:hypothetical protein